MATRPTPDETARRILALFEERSLRPGHTLGRQNLFELYKQPGFAREDFEPGMAHAVSKGWIRIEGSVSDPQYKLTEEGFREM